MSWTEWFAIIDTFLSILIEHLIKICCTEKSLVEEASKLTEFGGNFGGNVMPTHFLCLLLKMLQLQPEHNIVIAYIEQTTSKFGILFALLLF